MVGVFLFCVYLVFFSLLISSYRPRPAQPWWVKVMTEMPHCTYYFGPFESNDEAELRRSGYIEDLEEEGAKIVSVSVWQGQPRTLTVIKE
jgi:hypothetical protein